MHTYLYIKKWGDIYQQASINEYDLSFDQFLCDPQGSLDAIGQESAPECIENGFEPLLLAQAKVALRLREQEQELVSKVSD